MVKVLVTAPCENGFADVEKNVCRPVVLQKKIDLSVCDITKVGYVVVVGNCIVLDILVKHGRDLQVGKSPVSLCMQARPACSKCTP